MGKNREHGTAGPGWLMGLLLLACVTGTATQRAWPAPAGRPVEAETAGNKGPFLIQGVVQSVDGTIVTVKTADHGPGLTRGPGIRSRLVVLGKSFAADIAHAQFQAVDGTRAEAPALKQGDHVVMLVQSRGAAGTTNVRAIPVTATLIIANQASQ